MGPDTIWILIPLTALLIPVVVVFTKHQQRMAELLHQQPQQPNLGQQAEIDSLRQDMARLQNVVSTLAINVENLKDEVRSGGAIRDRIQTTE